MVHREVSPEQYDGNSLLSKNKSARILKVGKQFLQTLIENGEIGVVHIKGKVRIPYSELTGWVQSRLSYSIKNSATPEEAKQPPKNSAKEIMKKIKLNKWS